MSILKAASALSNTVIDLCNTVTTVTKLVNRTVEIGSVTVNRHYKRIKTGEALELAIEQQDQKLRALESWNKLMEREKANRLDPTKNWDENCAKLEEAVAKIQKELDKK